MFVLWSRETLDFVIANNEIVKKKRKKIHKKRKINRQASLVFL